MRVGLAFATPAVIDRARQGEGLVQPEPGQHRGGSGGAGDYDVMREHTRRVAATRARLTDALRALGYDVPPSHSELRPRAPPRQRQRRVYEALKQRRILVRYFATPELATTHAHHRRHRRRDRRAAAALRTLD
jgi:histidinol-phosphate aminotransferase